MQWRGTGSPTIPGRSGGTVRDQELSSHTSRGLRGVSGRAEHPCNAAARGASPRLPRGGRVPGATRSAQGGSSNPCSVTQVTPSMFMWLIRLIMHTGPTPAERGGKQRATRQAGRPAIFSDVIGRGRALGRQREQASQPRLRGDRGGDVAQDLVALLLERELDPALGGPAPPGDGTVPAAEAGCLW